MSRDWDECLGITRTLVRDDPDFRGARLCPRPHEGRIHIYLKSRPRVRVKGEPQLSAEEIIEKARLEAQLKQYVQDAHRWRAHERAATSNQQPEPTAKRKKQYRALNEPPDRESVVLVRLVAAVSAAFYMFDLQKATSPVISEIINALALYGIVSDRETVSGWLHYAAGVRGQADGLLRTRVKGTFCKLLGGMLRDSKGWLPTAEEFQALNAEERAARAEKLRTARAAELHADLAATACTVVSVEEILEALAFVDASV